MLLPLLHPLERSQIHLSSMFHCDIQDKILMPSLCLFFKKKKEKKDIKRDQLNKQNKSEQQKSCQVKSPEL